MKGTIGDFFTVKGGKRLPKGSQFDEGKTPYPYLRVTDFNKNSLNTEKIKYISKEIHKKIARYTISSSDIYISIAGTIGIAGIVPEEFEGANLTENAAKITPKKGVKVLPKYLSYYFNSGKIQEVIKSKTMAVGVPKLALFRIKEIPIELPPLTQQRRITEILETADALRQKDRELLAQYDRLAESVFLEMFGDPVRNERNWRKLQLKELGKVVTGNTPTRKREEYYGDHIEWIKTDNINTPEMYLTRAEEYLSEIGASRGRLVPAGSILVTCIAGSRRVIGTPAIADRLVAFNQQINALIPYNGNSIFLYYQFLLSKQMIQAHSTNSMKGMVNKTTFEGITFIFPPLEYQEKFSSIAENIEAQKKLVKQQIEQSETLFQSLLQRAFRGELFREMEQEQPSA